MSDGRFALAIGFAVALALDAYAFATLPVLRALVSRHHWIFYLYLTVMATLAIGGAIYLVMRAVRLARALVIPIRSARVAKSRPAAE